MSQLPYYQHRENIIKEIENCHKKLKAMYLLDDSDIVSASTMEELLCSTLEAFGYWDSEEVYKLFLVGCETQDATQKALFEIPSHLVHIIYKYHYELQASEEENQKLNMASSARQKMASIARQEAVSED